MKLDFFEFKTDPITKIQLVKYAGASGDFNPIHVIEEEAKATGLPSVIAHGMLTMGFMAQLFSEAIENGAYLRNLSTRFTSKVFVGDQLLLRAEKVDKEGKGTYGYSITVHNQKNELVAKGSANLAFVESTINI